MNDDELNGELSVSAELTETGLKAAAKSRLLNAVDYVSGKYLLAKFQSKASSTVEKAAVAKGRAAIIEAAAEAAVSRIKSDPAVAEAAIATSFGRMFQREENVASSLEHAAESLKLDPPDEYQTSSGPDRLSEDTLNRWTRYAEDASSEDLRERWGRVLAAEVRKPGTFSAKVLRAIDEIDADVASRFQRFCDDAIDGAVPRCIRERPLDFEETRELVEAGLLLNPSEGYIRIPQKMEMSDGTVSVFYIWGSAAVVFEEGTSPIIHATSEDAAFMKGEQGAVTPIYLMTEVGKAISSILPPSSSYPFGRLFAKCLAATGEGRPIAFFLAGDHWVRFPVQP